MDVHHRARTCRRRTGAAHRCRHVRRPDGLDPDRAGAGGGPCALPAQQRELGRGGLARPVGGARRATASWHMYVTARDASGAPGCGVVGHAVSEDLVDLGGAAAAELADRPLRVARGDLGGPGRGPLGAALLVPVHRDAGSSRGCRRGLVGSGRRARIAGGRVRRGAGHRRVDCTSARWSSTSGRRTSWRSATVARTQRFVGGITDPVPVTWRADGRGLDVDARLCGTRSVTGVTYNGSSGTYLPVRR